MYTAKRRGMGDVVCPEGTVADPTFTTCLAVAPTSGCVADSYVGPLMPGMTYCSTGSPVGPGQPAPTTRPSFSNVPWWMWGVGIFAGVFLFRAVSR